ncbi:MAG: hypothetical protein AAB372_02890 [Patescibacteria group bacterium]
MREIKATLDTNLLIYLFDFDANETNVLDSCSLVREIIECGKFISVDVQIATALESDFSNDADEIRREAILLRIRNLFQQVSLGRMIKIENELLPEDEDDRHDFQELKRILFPNFNPITKTYINNINDVRHIFSHIKNGRDIYITNDTNFLSNQKREAIKNAFHTQIMSVDEFVSHLHSYKDKSSYEYKSAPRRLDYENSALSGNSELDFTNNNGLFLIGNGDFLFEIAWGECSGERMRVSNDPKTIECIAMVEDKKLKEIISDRYYDFTDRFREPRRKLDILLLKNSKGYYAAVRVNEFGVKDRGYERNFVNFNYVINTQGNCNFKGLSF